MRYFLAPRSGERSYKNYQSSIKHGVPYQRIEPYLTLLGKEILSKQEIIYSWANREAKKYAWERMSVGDIVIFYAHYNLVMAGRVIYKQSSKELSLAMWPSDEKGKPWEYTFFLDNLKYFKIPIEYFNYISGYRFKNVQGFQEIAEPHLEKILSRYKDLTDLFAQFEDKDSMEIPTADEPVYINLTRKVKPEFISDFKLQPYSREGNNIISGNKAKQVDFEERQRRNSKTGSLGEEIVLKNEKDYLLSIGRSDLAREVERVSLNDISLGYDIISYDRLGQKKLIEVKSTTLPKTKKFSFNMSSNEKNVAEENGEKYYVYLVFDVNGVSPKIVSIKAPFALGLLIIEPTNFRIKGLSD